MGKSKSICSESSEVVKNKASKALRGTVPFAFALSLTSAFLFLLPNLSQAQACGEGAVCPPGNVKYEVGSAGDEYNDGSASIAADEDTASWSAATGYTITNVCIKIGGPGGGSLQYPDPAAGTAGPYSHGISHVVVTTTEPEPTGSISGIKFEDLNGNGTKDGGEEGLAGWTIFLDENSNGVLDGQEASTTTILGGGYEFTGLVAGSYVVREVLQGGWSQTAPASGKYELVLAPGGELTENDFGNQRLSAGLSITKDNNTLGSFINPGLDATFTIVVTNGGQDTVFNVEVSDTLPAGFTYKAGTATVEGTPTEPVIASNTLTWNIGDLTGGQSKTIIYITTADSDILKGTYTNTATAIGLGRFEDPVSSNIASSDVEVRIPEVLSMPIVVVSEPGEVLAAVEGLPITGSSLPNWPFLLVAIGFVLKIFERVLKVRFGKVV